LLISSKGFFALGLREQQHTDFICFRVQKQPFFGVKMHPSYPKQPFSTSILLTSKIKTQKLHRTSSGYHPKASVCLKALSTAAIPEIWPMTLSNS
jgi:hypothetical protein